MINSDDIFLRKSDLQYLLKTINNLSLIGTGNITITGGGGSTPTPIDGGKTYWARFTNEPNTSNNFQVNNSSNISFSVPFDNNYVYITIPSTYRISSARTANNEVITEDLKLVKPTEEGILRNGNNLSPSIVIDDVNYDVYEYHKSVPLNVTVSISITKK